ncbi:MAG: T9SS C-terminal target domain-containing protein [Ignavibacteriales bacterium]|nr:MAG: T9SS C-terminal target domain-containing protein [Ignavibacteriales bacterium]
MRRKFLIILIIFICSSFAENKFLFGQKLFINEIMSSNVLGYKNAEGEYEDWIEIYNPENYAVDLAGYYLSDDKDKNNLWQVSAGQPDKTIIPPKAFLVLVADGKPERSANHTDFKLDDNSEAIFLIGKDGLTIIDSIIYKNQFRDISYGRYPDGSADWFYMVDFSPGVLNKPGYKGYTKPPFVEPESGLYLGSTTITITPDNITNEIRFTINGSDPTESSTKYSSLVNINFTLVFKARSYNGNTLPSEIITKTYLLNTNHSLPVLVLTTDPKNLFDSATGIYVNDYDGREWERYAELNYFKNNSLAFHIPTGIRIQGNTGPTEYQKKSFSAYFRNGYGQEKLVFPFYPNDNVAAFRKLILRSGYDDSLEPTSGGKNSSATLIRDPLVTELWRRTGFVTPQSSFAVLYLNNDYYGIYDIKESIDENFIRDHTGYEDVDIIRTRWDSTEVVYGNDLKWKDLISFFKNHSFADDSEIAEAEKLIDLDNFITLQAIMHVAGYSGWAYGMFMFREKSAEGKWKFTVWDADRSYNDVNWNGFTAQPNPVGVFIDTLITKKLLKNINFRSRYINRIHDLINTAFSSSEIKSLIDSLAQSIQGEIPAEVSKWNNTVEKWSANVNNLKTFSEQRQEKIRTQIKDYFKLSGNSELTLNVTGAGRIKINSVNTDQFPWKGVYSNGIPLTLSAIAEPGYRFTGWDDSSLPQDETITISLEGDKSVTAQFVKLESSNAELIALKRIKTGQYLPVIVRIRDANWNINPFDQTPVNLIFNGAHADSTIKIKRGAGAGVLQINSQSNFLLSVSNSNLTTQKQIKVNDLSVQSYTGSLPVGETIWDKTFDRNVTNDLTIPSGSTLRITKGTWVTIKKFVNVYVRGKLIVEGSADEPVVITSEKWSEPWGGIEFSNGRADFKYCIVLNGAGDNSKGNPTSDGWHTGHQHMFFGMNNSDFNFDNCFFIHSPGKVFGAQDSRVTVTNSLTSFVWLGGEFHRVLLKYKKSHLMNLPDEESYLDGDIDTDGFHIDYLNANYPQYSLIDSCYFITGKDDAIDHHYARLKITNCWLEDFNHEGVATSGGDTVQIFNTVALNNDQGFEAGWTESNVSKGPYVFIDHCVATENNTGLRIGDSYDWTYKDYMKVTNSVIYNNGDNIRNYLNSTHASLPGALEISYSMTNDADYDNSPHCITGIPQFDELYYLLPGSPGINMGMNGSNMGRADSLVIKSGSVVINEIMYNAPAEQNSKDWIELYNPQNTEQNISGWVLKDDNNSHSFVIPSDIKIPANSFLVLCSDTSVFKTIHPEVKNITGNFSFGFGDSDQVRIYTINNILVDSVSYTNKSPWPAEADGDGFSLVLIDPEKDHTDPANWNRSVQFGGSPGRGNLSTGVTEGNTDNLPEEYFLYQNYPNPFNPVTTIKFVIPHVETGYIPSLQNVNLKVYDVLGREVRTLVNEEISPGTYEVIFNGSNLSSGIYFYRLQAGEFVQTKKLILMK